MSLENFNYRSNRWCGAYLQSKGIRVIPTINWGTEKSFDFCFAGVPKGLPLQYQLICFTLTEITQIKKICL